MDNNFEKETLSFQEVVDLKEEASPDVKSSEQELNSFVEKGDFELLFDSPAFNKRSLQGQAIIISNTVNNRVRSLDLLMTDALREGQEGRATAMSIIQESKKLKHARDQIIKVVFGDKQRPIPEETW